jgi:uncharacterized protein (TIGR03067 family)
MRPTKVLCSTNQSQEIDGTMMRMVRIVWPAPLIRRGRKAARHHYGTTVMHIPTILGLGLLILATGFAAFAQSAEEAERRLQGTWTATRAQRDGKAADDVVGHRLSFAGSQFRIQSSDGKALFMGTIRLDRGTKPAGIDFEHEGDLKGKVWRGIYSLDGDTLTICDNAPNLDKGRPAAFEAASGSGHIVVTFKRGR